MGLAKRDDPTVKLLYAVAKRVFEDGDARKDDINIICSKAESQFNKAVTFLVKNIPEFRTVFTIDWSKRKNYVRNVSPYHINRADKQPQELQQLPAEFPIQK